MFRRVLMSIAAASVVLAAGCTSDSKTPTGTAAPNTVLPDDTVPAPGTCEPAADDPPVPHVVVDGKSTEATLGESSDPCDALTGDGFLAFDYNPVLLDSDGSVRVDVGGGAKAQLTWSLGAPFVEVQPGRWESSARTHGCARLLIDLVSASGASTATYGADIRVGGSDIACPQRTLDPTEATG